MFGDEADEYTGQKATHTGDIRPQQMETVNHPRVLIDPPMNQFDLSFTETLYELFYKQTIRVLFDNWALGGSR